MKLSNTDKNVESLRNEIIKELESEVSTDKNNSQIEKRKLINIEESSTKRTKKRRFI